MAPRAGRPRAVWAWRGRSPIGVFPAAAVLASAVGIAYLGAVSYLADRRLVAAKAADSAALAQRVADAAETELREALHAAAAVAAGGAGDVREVAFSAPALDKLAAAHPLARQPFYLNREGRLLYPSAVPRGHKDAAPDREFMALLSHSGRIDPRREAALDAAHREEVGVCPAGRRCRPTARGLWAARRAYARLARHPDTGPEALLGLARIERASERPAQAATRYRELDQRFPDRVDDEGIPYALLAQLGLSEVTERAEPLLACLEKLASGEFGLPGPLEGFLTHRVRALLRSRRLTAEGQARLAVLDRRLSQAREAARLAGRLADDLGPIARSAGPTPRGRPASGAPDRELIYRRVASGGVVGLAFERAGLDSLATAALPVRERESGMRAVVLPSGEGPGAHLRVLGSAPLSPLAPHLSLVLVQDRSRPDPVAEMVKQRSRRHLALSGGLVAVLLLGLVATIRGAARERELSRLKSDFVSTVSHELKTPLTSIRMFAEMLVEGVADGDRDRERRYQKIIVKESERLGLLIANLLDYAQIERGTRRYNRRRESAAGLCREAVDTFGRLREGEGQPVALDLGASAAAAAVWVDREVTVQALLNLLSNAVKYGGEGHPVEVALAVRPDGEVAVSVRDRGPGIPAAEHDRIFREFYRAPAAYSAGVEGTGLGLALVKRHIEAQGGRVELDSGPGRGAAFTLVMPAAPAAADEGAADETAADETAETGRDEAAS